MAAVAWSLAFQSTALVFGFILMPNGLWQLGAVTLLVGLVLACGWLQTVMNWYPPEITFDPPPAADLHDHDHDAHNSDAAPAPSHATH
jgi:hypothetical protein